MVQIEDKLISEDIFSQDFVCNLSKCKGICCIEGDSGAPLEKEETEILRRIFPEIKSYLRPEGISAIEQQGTHVIDFEEDLVTPLVNNKECAYVIFDEDGTTKCSIEKAYEDGVVGWRKPISCHLYPIRVTEYPSFTALNYHQWNVCSDACVLGKELGVRIYQFLKEPLIRKYGESWYQTLSEAAEEWEKEFKK